MIEFGKYVLAADILNCMQFPVLGCLQKITYEQANPILRYVEITTITNHKLLCCFFRGPDATEVSTTEMIVDVKNGEKG